MRRLMELPQPRTALIAHHAVRVYCDSRACAEAHFLAREIFDDRAYLRHGITLKCGDTIFDVGANIGLFSIYAYRKCDGLCTILAFEPVRSTFAYLQRNLAAHGLPLHTSVHLFNVGLTSLSGPQRARFTVYPAMPGNATMHRAAKEAQLDSFVERTLEALKQRGGREYRFMASLFTRHYGAKREWYEEECMLTTIAEVSRFNQVARIDLLKVDVEGAELEVIDGIDEDAWPRIRQLVVETHGEPAARALRERLHWRGFRSIIAEQPAWARQFGLDNFTLYCAR